MSVSSWTLRNTLTVVTNVLDKYTSVLKMHQGVNETLPLRTQQTGTGFSN